MKLLAILLSVLMMLPACAHAQSGAVPPTVLKIKFTADIDDASAEELEAAFKVVAESKPDAVVIVIDSPGGSLQAGWKIIKILRASPVPVHCIVDGEADSMAFVMLQACTSRGMTGESRLLAHQPYVRLGGEPVHINELKSLLNNMVALAEQIDVLCANRMGITVDEYQAQTNAIDWWMSSIGAIKANAVDYVAPTLSAALLVLEQTSSLPH